MTTFSGSAHAPLRIDTVTNGETLRILIQGEADIASVEQLDAALTGIRLDGTSKVLLDASGLTFFDAAVLRRLIVFARSVRQTGRALTTCGASPLLHDVVRMLELQDDLGLH